MLNYPVTAKTTELDTVKLETVKYLQFNLICNYYQINEIFDIFVIDTL